MTTDDFDVKQLRIGQEIIREAPIETETTKRLKAKRDARRQIVVRPWNWVMALTRARLASTSKLADFLLYEFWRSPNKPATVSNLAAAEFGLSRTAKSRALRELVGLGLVRVEQSGNQTPRVYRRA